MTKVLEPKARRWRIEYCTDLTRSEAVVIPVGFMVEADWNAARWLGMIFRRRLTTVELDHVNIHTWGELRAPEPFMKELFQEAWSSGRTGAADIAGRYPAYTALRFAPEEIDDLQLTLDHREGFLASYAHLHSLADRLTPVMTAQILKLQPKAKPVVPDFGSLTEAA